MNAVAGDYFVDCSICQSIFQAWGFRRLVQDHDSLDENWKLGYLQKDCMNSAVLSSLISMTNHKFHHKSMCVWHTVIDLESLQDGKKPQSTPDMVNSEKLSTYNIKERIIVFICRSGMHFYTVGLEHHGNKWVCLVFDSLQTTVPQKKKELNPILIKFNINPEQIQVNILNTMKQRDGSSCGFYAFFYFYRYVCNDSTEQKTLQDIINCSANSDMTMRQFCIQQYECLFGAYKSSFLKFGCLATRRKNFILHGCLVAHSANGQIVTYHQRASDQLWSFALRKENLLKIKTPTSSSNIITIPLVEAVELIKKNQPSHDTTHLDVLSVKKLDDNNYRFNIKVVQDLSFDSGNYNHLIETSKDLIMKWFEPQDRQKLNQMFSMIKNTKYRYMMVSLFGVTCNQWRNKHPGVSEETKCVGTLIGVNSYMGLYISHLAVSSENYSKGVFGNSSDQRPFRKRGIAGVLLCVAQSFSKVYNDNLSIYSWSYNENRTKENKHCCWSLMGFRDADTSSIKEWPVEMSYLIEHFTFYSDETCQHLERLTPMVASSNLKYMFNTFLCSGSSLDIREKDLVHQWPLHSSEDYVCGEIINHLKNRCCNTHVDIPTNLRTKYVMFEKRLELLSKQHNLLDYLEENQEISTIAIEYFSFLFMLQFPNVYILSSDFSHMCMKDGFNSQLCLLHPDMLIISEQSKDPNAMFLFPFLENFDKKDGCWSFVLYRWIESQIFFFYCSSDTPNCDKYSVNVARKVPDQIIEMFMKCPLWSLAEYANWVNVPVVKMEETTNKSFIFLSMYMLAMSKSPHKALLLLHHLPDSHKSKMQSLNRGWISFILHFKCWFAPMWLKKLMKKDTEHSYSLSWCRKKCKRVLLEKPPEEFDTLMTSQQEGTPIETDLVITSQHEGTPIESDVVVRSQQEGTPIESDVVQKT